MHEVDNDSFFDAKPKPEKTLLTYEQVLEIWLSLNPQPLLAFARAIEAAHGITNDSAKGNV